MKKVNLWKTLFLSALAVAAFTGCSNDDSDEGGGMPSITVNGQKSATLSIGLAGGKTEAVTIESSGDWTMTVTGDEGADAKACQPSLSSGSKGTTTVTFDLTKATTPRSYTVKVTTSGTIPGIGMATDFSATIKIEQTDAFVPTDEPLFYEDCGTTGADSKPKVYSYKGWSRKGSLSQTDVVYATSSNTSVRTGTGSYLPTADEKSAVSGPNWIYIGYADQDFEIQNINVGTATDFTFTFTAQLQKGYGDSPEFETNLSSSIIKLSVSTDGLSYNEVPFTTKQVATGGSWILCSSEFKLPAGVQTSTISVRLSDFAQQDGYQFRVDDFKLYEGGNGDALPAPATPTTATIGEITEAGLFAVKDATVIIRSDEGCIIADATGAMMIYGSNELAVGDKINISGSVTIHQSSNVPQFNLSTSGTEVETVSKGNSWTYDNFTEYSVEDIRSYFNNIKCLPVQIAGTIVEDSGHYNVVFDGVSDVQGSVEYYTPEASVLNVPVVIKGYATGKSSYNNITRIKIFPYSIEVSSSTPYITATAPASFKAEGETIEVSYKVGNLGSNKVFAKLEGNDAGQFSVGEVADGKVSVTAKANEGAACQATLVLYIAASEGGEILAQTSVTLKQSAKQTGDDTRGTYESMPIFVPTSGSSTSNPAPLGDMTINGKTCSGFKLGSSSKAGTFTSAALGVSGSKKLAFYALGWTGKSEVPLVIEVNNGGSANVTTFSLVGNEAITGNPPFKDVVPSDDTDYYIVELSDLTPASTITFKTTIASNGRAVVFGIQLF